MPAVSDFLSKLDIGTLERLAGETVVRAVRSAYDTNRESALAQLVADKFGQSILASKSIRAAIVDCLSDATARDLCSIVGIGLQPQDVPHARLQKHFATFGEAKSRQFVQGLDLPEELVVRAVHDPRTAVVELNNASGDTLPLRPYLHPFQKRVKDAVVKQISDEGRRLMVQMPTGAGKTFTALEAVVDIFRLPFQRQFVVWIVDSNELAEQALATFQYLWRAKGDRPLRVYRLFSDFAPPFEEHEGGMVFASFDKVHSVLANHSHRAYKSVWHLIRNTTLLVVDEAHASVAETYEPTIRGFLSTSSTRLVGLSATPGRTDPALAQELARLYTGNLVTISGDDGCPISDPIEYLQANGYLARINPEELESGIDIADDNESRICKALAEDPKRNATILKQILRAHEQDEPTLVFSCTKDHVLALMALCRAKHIPAEFITGDTPQANRNDILERFRKGSYRVLINYEIVSTGIDLPNVSRMIITRPIGSAILYSQILGRALRGPKNGGNPENTVVNIRDNLRNFLSASFVYNSFQYGFSTHDVP